ncbi:MAG: hypothetical protein WC654_04170 [Patescibacteria group bacterium]
MPNRNCEECIEHEKNAMGRVPFTRSESGTAIGFWLLGAIIASMLLYAEYHLGDGKTESGLFGIFGVILCLALVGLGLPGSIWFFYTNICGLREYLSLDEDGTVHRHPAIQRYDSLVVVEAWLGGWFRKSRVLRGRLSWNISDWNGTSLTFSQDSTGKEQLRLEWDAALPLFGQSQWLAGIVFDFLNIETKFAPLREQITTHQADAQQARVARNEYLVELMVLTRLTGREDPLGWGRSKHGAEMNARLLAILSGLPVETLDSLKPDADAIVLRLTDTANLLARRDPPAPLA